MILQLKSLQKIEIIGETVISSRYQQRGSSLINLTQLGNAYCNAKKAEINFVYDQGYKKDMIKTKDSKAFLNEATQIV
jgi:hypothetical protein